MHYCTKNRHATQHDIGRYSLGNVQAMFLNLVCNACSCNLRRERGNTRSRLYATGWWLDYLPEEIHQQLSVCLLLLIQTLLRNIAVLD
jgi:hypothetical protein